jgi:hypothetical protein
MNQHERYSMDMRAYKNRRDQAHSGDAAVDRTEYEKVLVVQCKDKHRDSERSTKE